MKHAAHSDCQNNIRVLILHRHASPENSLLDLHIQLLPGLGKQAAINDTLGHIQLGLFMERVIAEIDGLSSLLGIVRAP